MSVIFPAEGEDAILELVKDNAGGYVRLFTTPTIVGASTVWSDISWVSTATLAQIAPSWQSITQVGGKATMTGSPMTFTASNMTSTLTLSGWAWATFSPSPTTLYCIETFSGGARTLFVDGDGITVEPVVKLFDTNS